MKEKKELTELQKKFLVALFGEAQGNYREAMRIAGYSEFTTVKEVMNGLKEEVVDHCNSALAALAPKAIMKMGNLLDDANVAGASNQIKVIQDILDRAGMAKKASGEDVTMKVPSGGIFILPAKEIQEFKRVEEDGE